MVQKTTKPVVVAAEYRGARGALIPLKDELVFASVAGETLAEFPYSDIEWFRTYETTRVTADYIVMVKYLRFGILELRMRPESGHADVHAFIVPPIHAQLDRALKSAGVKRRWFKWIARLPK